MKAHWTYAALLPVLLPVSTAYGEQDGAAQSDAVRMDGLDALSLEDLLNVVVTASAGVKEDIAMAPANVQSISADEIGLHGWRSLSEVLANVLGLYVIQDLVQPSVSIRGVSGGYRAGTRIFKIMIDGVEVSFRPDLTAAIGPEYIPIEAIDHIEVAKGPLSALYGANAFLTTVNVITRSAPEGVSGSLALRLWQHKGSAPGFGVSFSAGFADGRQSLLVAATADRMDRSGLTIQKTFDQNPARPRFAPLFGNQSRNDLSKPVGLFGKYSLDTKFMGTLSMEGGMQHTDAMAEFRPNSVFTGKSRYSLRNFWWSGRHDVPWSDWIDSTTHVGVAYGSPTNDERLFLSGSDAVYFSRRFSYFTADASFAVNARLGDQAIFSAGVDSMVERDQVLYFSQTTLKDSGATRAGTTTELTVPGDVTQINMHNVGVRAQLTFHPIPHSEALKLSGNFRLDFPSVFEPQWSWRAAAAYRWNAFMVTKLIVGRSFQAPSAELMWGLPGFGAASNIVGSRTRKDGRVPLVPQIIRSAEMVSSFHIPRHVAAEVAMFVQEVDQKIEMLQLSSNFVPVNRGKQRALGVEASVRHHMGPVTPYLQGAVVMTATDDGADALEGDTGLSLEAPSAFPTVSSIAGVNFNLPGGFVRGNVQLRLVGARGPSQSNIQLNNGQRYVLAPYGMVDMGLSTRPLQLFGGGTETVLTFAARNLLDAQVSEPGFDGFDIPLQRRVVMLQFSQSL